MRSLLYLSIVLVGTALSTGGVPNNCEISKCPFVKCRGDNLKALCDCVAKRELLCQKGCPDYVPDFQSCTASVPTPSPLPSPIPESYPVPKHVKPITCECPKVNCLQVWPGSCHCTNSAAENCYNKCGGAPPVLQYCPVEEVVAQASELGLEAWADAHCKCDKIMCKQAWPESCYCTKAAAEICYKKCGIKNSALQMTCPPRIIKTLTTMTSTRKPSPTPIPINHHMPCGGGRANSLTCDEGYVCIDDPFTPGCGPACDGPGICVKEKMCGGFAGFPCEESGQQCHDDPRDDCDPKSGGADCGGLCVWPH